MIVLLKTRKIMYTVEKSKTSLSKITQKLKNNKCTVVSYTSLFC